MTEDESVAAAKRARFEGMTDTEFMLWRHHPLTASFLQYLGDLVGMYREKIADFVETGAMKAGADHIDLNPESMRGQIFILRQLQALKLEQIQTFYGITPPTEEKGSSHESHGNKAKSDTPTGY